ncbi:MAG: hypothetical protein NWF00_09270 [Candidatus Bathyarchaeota archaeon]|nr:hypothetical protein [Candidatus Bathyarchaeota archaeon]
MSITYFKESKIRPLHASKVIAVILLIAIAMPIIALPTATAQQVQKQTYAYIGALPNPAGVGQEVLLHVGITDASNWQQGPWTGLTVDVTKPDGSKETLGPFTTDLTGGTGAV